MHIEKVTIQDYKCFKGVFPLNLNPGINMIVGNNEVGKSTILEAVHLALTGILNGRYLRYELSQYLFNTETSEEYITSLSSADPLPPPEIRIEVFLQGGDLPLFEGDGNSDRKKACGVVYKVIFDTEYQSQYEALVGTGKVTTIPIEYYTTSWKSFARQPITAQSIPFKPVLIDSAARRYQNGSDIYISRIINDELDDSEKVELAQAYRKMKEAFIEDNSVRKINRKIGKKSSVSGKSIEVSVDLSTQRSWETALMTYFDKIPFHQIGKGEQCVVKTALALGHRKAEQANLIIMEEPENHLTHAKMNELLKYVQERCGKRQILVSTHSSFVANKLGLEHLILLRDGTAATLAGLGDATQKFFKTLPGYQTLRLLLCRKALLVEGDSDELIVQKAYMNEHGGRLPIENGIDVISVGLTFKRFLTMARLVEQPVAVVRDNDGDFDKFVRQNYKAFDAVEYIEVFADERDDLYTLEPQFADANRTNLSTLRKVLGLKRSAYPDAAALADYMLKHKTGWALKVFESDEDLSFPEYILQAVRWCDG